MKDHVKKIEEAIQNLRTLLDYQHKEIFEDILKNIQFIVNSYEKIFKLFNDSVNVIKEDTEQIKLITEDKKKTIEKLNSSLEEQNKMSLKIKKIEEDYDLYKETCFSLLIEDDKKRYLEKINDPVSLISFFSTVKIDIERIVSYYLGKEIFDEAKDKLCSLELDEKNKYAPFLDALLRLRNSIIELQKLCSQKKPEKITGKLKIIDDVKNLQKEDENFLEVTKNKISQIILDDKEKEIKKTIKEKKIIEEKYSNLSNENEKISQEVEKLKNENLKLQEKIKLLEKKDEDYEKRLKKIKLDDLERELKETKEKYLKIETKHIKDKFENMFLKNDKKEDFNSIYYEFFMPYKDKGLVEQKTNIYVIMLSLEIDDKKIKPGRLYLYKNKEGVGYALKNPDLSKIDRGTITKEDLEEKCFETVYKSLDKYRLQEIDENTEDAIFKVVSTQISSNIESIHKVNIDIDKFKLNN